VTSYLTDPVRNLGGRPKRIYQLTPKGRQALLHIRTVENAMWSEIKGLALDA